jgi:hypothetical protein
VSEKLEAMKNQALHVHQQFTSVIRTQNYLRYREARHRNTAERCGDTTWPAWIAARRM